jgi:hypothetical protein
MWWLPIALADCDVPAAFQAWDDADLEDQGVALQRVADAAGCAPLVDPASTAWWLRRFGGGRGSGTELFEVTGFPGPIWAAVDGIVIETPAELRPGPHVVQLGLPGSERPLHGAILFLVAGVAERWAVADLSDQMIVFGCDDLDGWLDLAEQSPAEDRDILVGAARSLQECPAFSEGDVLQRWSALAAFSDDADPDLLAKARADRANRSAAVWKRRYAAVRWSHLAIPLVLGSIAGEGWLLSKGTAPGLAGALGFVLITIAAPMTQTALLRPIGVAPETWPMLFGFGVIGVLAPPAGLVTVPLGAITQIVLNEIALAKDAHRRRALSRSARPG